MPTQELDEGPRAARPAGVVGPGGPGGPLPSNGLTAGAEARALSQHVLRKQVSSYRYRLDPHCEKKSTGKVQDISGRQFDQTLRIRGSTEVLYLFPAVFRTEPYRHHKNMNLFFKGRNRHGVQKGQMKDT